MPYDDPNLKEFDNYYQARRVPARGHQRRGEGGAWQRRECRGQKAVRKGGQKTVDRLLALMASHPHITQAGMVAALGITRSTVQKHLSNLKSAGKLRRVGPDKGGHWEVIG